LTWNGLKSAVGTQNNDIDNDNGQFIDVLTIVCVAAEIKQSYSLCPLNGRLPTAGLITLIDCLWTPFPKLRSVDLSQGIFGV